MKQYIFYNDFYPVQRTRYSSGLDKMEYGLLADQTVNTLGTYFQYGAMLLELRDQIVLVFDEEELKDLALFLGVSYDALPGSGTSSKAREIVTLCWRKKRLTELLAQCGKLRPNSDWPDAQEFASDLDAQQLDQASKLNRLLEQQFSEDPDAAATLARLAEQPGSSSRKTALSNYLETLLEADPAIADYLQTVMGAKPSSPDIIKQEVSLSGQAKAGDIKVIGKIEGNAKKSWWQRLLNE